MLKKTLIIGIILASLLIISTFSVSAVDDTKEIDDIEDDVQKTDDLGETGTIVDYKPNVDITKLKYEQKDQTVTITLTVKGKIEDRGDYWDLEDPDVDYDEEGNIDWSDFSIDFVVYQIDMETSANIYSIVYGNKECNISTLDNDFIEQNSWSVTNSDLILSFNLPNEDETLTFIQSYATDWKFNILVNNVYVDYAPDFVELDTTINAPSEGKVNTSISFSGKVDGGSSEYNWYWDFGDGNSSTEQNPTHSFDKIGTYEVTLDVEDEYFNYGYTSFSITITDSNNKNGIDGTAKVGDALEESSSSALLMFIALIAIIAVAGIAVLVHIIRK
jgi:hypothetical protein